MSHIYTSVGWEIPLPSVFIFLTPVWTPRCGDYWEHVTQDANFIIFLLHKHPYYSLPCTLHGIKYWHFSNPLAMGCVSSVLSTFYLLKVKYRTWPERLYYWSLKLSLKRLFICQPNVWRNACRMLHILRNLYGYIGARAATHSDQMLKKPLSTVHPTRWKQHVATEAAASFLAGVTGITTAW